jgi:hypothetical protein
MRGLSEFSVRLPRSTGRYATSRTLILPAHSVSVLAVLLMDEGMEIFYFEEEAMLVALLVIVRGEHTV